MNGHGGLYKAPMMEEGREKRKAKRRGGLDQVY